MPRQAYRIVRCQQVIGVQFGLPFGAIDLAQFLHHDQPLIGFKVGKNLRNF